MRGCNSRGALWLTGGTLLGAAALYALYETGTGARSRKWVSHAAADAYERARRAAGSAGDAISDAYGSAVHQAHDYADSAAEAADRYRHLANKRGHDAWSQAHDAYDAHRDMAGNWVHRVADAARGYVHDAQSHLGQAWHRVRAEVADRAGDWRHSVARRSPHTAATARAVLGIEEQSHYGAKVAGLTSGAVGLVALGAGAAYFFDVDRGDKRRQALMSAVGNMASECGQMARSTGATIGRMWSRVVHGSNEAMRRVKEDSQFLLQRIRGEMANAMAGDVSQLQFMCDADGTVTVTGNALRDRVDAILSRLHEIPGVRHVINRIEIRRSMEHRGVAPEATAL